MKTFIEGTAFGLIIVLFLSAWYQNERIEDVHYLLCKDNWEQTGCVGWEEYYD